MKITVIKKLLDERDSILKEDVESKIADEYQKNIISAIKKYFDIYEVDFIIETFTRFGASPNLIYDDNGLFAIVEEGYQQAVVGNQKIEGGFTLFVKKKQWKKSIREALKYYISKH